MNKLWYTTIILATAVVALGIFFFLVLPRNRPSNGAPIALLDSPPDDSFSMRTSDKDKPSSSIPDEFSLPLDTTFQDEDLIPPDPRQQLLSQQDFPGYDGTDSKPTTSPPPIHPPPVPSPAKAIKVVQPVGGRAHTDTHTVKSGEWFAHITNQYWGDFFLWPDLYTLNKMRSHDPDLIYPGELVNIYQSLVEDDILDPQEKGVLMQAYLSVYRTYKKLGPNKNQSIWRLLYSATRYEPNFLSIYSDQIDSHDREMAAQLVQEAHNID